MGASSTKKFVPAWGYELRAGIPCAFCGSDERVVVAPATLGGPPLAGVCESCASTLHWIWRTTPGEAPGAAGSELSVAVVKVLVLKLRQLGKKASSEGLQPDPSAPESYDFAAVRSGTGIMDLPSAPVASGDEASAVSAALAGAGIVTWAPFVEPLYAAHTARGKVARVYLASAWRAESGRVEWRPWPPWEDLESTGALYLALRDVLPLWLSREEPASVQVREAAAKYVEIQQALRADLEVDASLAPFLRQSMSDAEKEVDRRVREHEELLAAALGETSPREADPALEIAGPRIKEPPPEGLRPEGLRPEGLRPEADAPAVGTDFDYNGGESQEDDDDDEDDMPF